MAGACVKVASLQATDGEGALPRQPQACGLDWDFQVLFLPDPDLISPFLGGED